MATERRILAGYSSSTREITDAVMALYDRITDKNLLVRRVTVAANRVLPEDKIPRAAESGEQLDLFLPRRRRGARPAARSRRRASANAGGRKLFLPSSGATAATPY